MPTRVRFGVTDGAIDVISAAVGKYQLLRELQATAQKWARRKVLSGAAYFGPSCVEEQSLPQHVELRGWSAVMPIFKFLVVTGFTLITLLFAANAMLQPGSPPIVTSQRTGLPEPRYHNAARALTNAPAPAPDMTSQAVRDAQPRSVLEALPKIEPAAREARAEAPPKNLRNKVSAQTRAEAQPQNNSFTQPIDHQQNQFDRFSIKGY